MVLSRGDGAISDGDPRAGAMGTLGVREGMREGKPPRGCWLVGEAGGSPKGLGGCRAVMRGTGRGRMPRGARGVAVWRDHGLAGMQSPGNGMRPHAPAHAPGTVWPASAPATERGRKLPPAPPSWVSDRIGGRLAPPLSFPEGIKARGPPPHSPPVPALRAPPQDSPSSPLRGAVPPRP